MLSVPTAMARPPPDALVEAGTGHRRAVGVQLLIVDLMVGADQEYFRPDAALAHGDGQTTARSLCWKLAPAIGVPLAFNC